MPFTAPPKQNGNPARAGLPFCFIVLPFENARPAVAMPALPTDAMILEPVCRQSRFRRLNLAATSDGC